MVGEATWDFARGLLRRRLPLLALYAGTTGSLIVGSAAQLVTFAILARAFGAGPFGTYTVMTAVTNLAVQVCGLGGSETMVRRVARDPQAYRAALGHNLILIALSGTPLVVGLTLVLPTFIHLGADPLMNRLAFFVFALTNVVLVRWILLTEMVFMGRFEVSTGNAVNLFYALARTATAIVACLVFKVVRVETFVFWLFAGHLVVAVGCAWTLRRFGMPRWALMRGETKLGVYFCTPLIFQALRQSADLLVLHVVATPEVVGSYSMARRILDTSALTTGALFRMSYPRLARATEGGLRAAWPLIVTVLKAALAIAVATAAATYIAAPLMPWLFGRDFGLMISLLHVMCWALILVTIHTVAAEALGASAEHWVRASIYNVGMLGGAALAALLTYLFNIEGTIATIYIVEASLAVAFWTVLLAFIRREPVPGPVPGVPSSGAPS